MYSHPERPLSIAELARRCPLTEAAIRERIKRGMLPYHRLGRRIYLLPSEVQAALGTTLFRQ